MTMAYSPDLLDYVCVGSSVTIAPHVAQHSDIQLDIASLAATTMGSEPVDVLEKIRLLEIVWAGEREELNNDLAQARHRSNEVCPFLLYVHGGFRRLIFCMASWRRTDRLHWYALLSYREHWTMSRIDSLEPCGRMWTMI